MATLLESLRTSNRADREAALSTYRELIARNASPQKGDADQLREACDVLGLTETDVRQDVNALAEADRLNSLAIPDEQIDQLSDTAAAVDRETQQWYRDQVNRLATEAGANAANIFAMIVSGTQLTTEAFGRLEAERRRVFGKQCDAQLALYSAREQTKKAAADNARLRAEHPRVFAGGVA